MREGNNAAIWFILHCAEDRSKYGRSRTSKLNPADSYNLVVELMSLPKRRVLLLVGQQRLGRLGKGSMSSRSIPVLIHQ